MPEVILNDIPVNFPFEPYEVQKDYMRKVLECLQKGVNGVLESPTGTGKTLSLLCSSLAWLEIKKAQIQATLRMSGNQGPNSMMQALNQASGVTQAESQSWGSIVCMPKIIYASRTHSQLAQAVSELKRTHYNHVKVAVMGSRDQLCLHPDVSKETNPGLKISMCRTKVSTKTCHFYNNVEKTKSDTSFSAIMDIEDLVSKGRKALCCPYYLSREMHKNADIVFVPYNYLLDARIRDLQDIQLANNIIILDEAHNVEKVCEESASFTLSSTDIAVCITEVTHVMKDFHEQMESRTFGFDDQSVAKDFSAEDLCLLKTLFTELEDVIDAVDIQTERVDDNSGAAFPGSYILDILARVEITPERLFPVIETIYNVSQYLSVTSESSYQHRGAGLQKFHDFLKVVARSVGGPLGDRSLVDKYYKLYVEPEVMKKGRYDPWQSKITSSKNNPKLLNFWCFSAGFGMRSLIELGVRSIILTSGTLSPLEATIYELGIPIEVKLENPHIVKGNQVCVSVLKVGPNGKELKSTYENRSSGTYLSELASTLQNFSRVVPHGLLVFFPSYSTMEKTVSYWQENGLWSKIQNSKPIFVEPHQKDALSEVMKQYYEAVDSEQSTKGAILLAVCRGKVSEGLDFANQRGRAVVITGLPFPPFKDPKVMLKRQYIDQNRSTEKSLSSHSGAEWYRLEATRAVNQAVGRVIRHASDYGAILLCDNRFAFHTNTRALSKWLQPHVNVCDKFGPAFSLLVKFFRAIGPPRTIRSDQSATGASFIYNGELKEREESAEEVSKKEEQRKKKIQQIVEEKKAMMRKVLANTMQADKPDKPQPKNLLAALDCAEEEILTNVVDSSSAKRTADTSFSQNSEDVQDAGISSSGRGQLENSTKKRRIRIVRGNETSSPTPSITSSSSSVSSSAATAGSSEGGRTANDLVSQFTFESARAIVEKYALSIASIGKQDIKEVVHAYWWLVKQTSSEEKFKAFKLVVTNYRWNRKVKDVIESLRTLFPPHSPDTLLLLKGFSIMLLPADKIELKNFCDANNIK
ncbi:regulator of telomere elongation helicase 1 homolog [Nilaparvata lugens]|uniref:regulator of telomere elongation helicase 1 homolog n=1 Tax=Nilaparvata lugens TaxID=108931 RepID=UPI000B998511|nr:regulator of telomere elongation helicase 1 homolog [Nilaparvata lugens]